MNVGLVVKKWGFYAKCPASSPNFGLIWVNFTGRGRHISQFGPKPEPSSGTKTLVFLRKD